MKEKTKYAAWGKWWEDHMNTPALRAALLQHIRHQRIWSLDNLTGNEAPPIPLFKNPLAYKIQDVRSEGTVRSGMSQRGMELAWVTWAARTGWRKEIPSIFTNGFHGGVDDSEVHVQVIPFCQTAPFFVPHKPQTQLHIWNCRNWSSQREAKNHISKPKHSMSNNRLEVPL